MTSLADLRKLLKKRELLKEKINQIELFVSKFESGNNLIEIKLRIGELQKIKDEYESVNSEIIINADDESDKISESSKTDVDEMRQFDEQWFKLVGKMELLLGNNSNSVSSENGVIEGAPQTGPPQLKVRLPVIALPEFSGRYTEWLPFFDAFTSLIHGNPALDNCQKFHYLNSCLKNEAARSIESLSISSSNYTVAWSLLQKRYKNNRLIVNSHVQAILNFPETSKCTAESLRKLIDAVNSNLEALKVLKIPVESWDALLLPILLSKLDYKIRKEVEDTLTDEVPTLSQVIGVLEKRFVVLESTVQNNKYQLNDHSSKKHGTNTRAAHVVTNRFSCHFCRKNHCVNKCENFLKLSLKERIGEINKRKLCANCLRDNHAIADCKSRGCNRCQARHHTLLHCTENANKTDRTRERINGPQSSSNFCNRKKSNEENTAILATAVVLLKDSEGNYREFRSLLDAGSQINILSKTACEQLQLPIDQTKLSITGINNTCTHSNKTTDVTIKSSTSNYEKTVKCFVLEQVTAKIPLQSFNKQNLNIPDNIELADPKFNKSQYIDLLIGAELFWQILDTGRILIPDTNLYLSETRLGWIVGGAFTDKQRVSNLVCNLARNRNNELKNLLEKFWTQEEISSPGAVFSKEELAAEKHFVETFKRDEKEGRFLIGLPKRNNEVKLGDSKTIALKRFLLLEKKFRKEKDLKEVYSEAISELMKLGVLQEVPENEIEKEEVFYLPHSGVIKYTNGIPKIRIVYDGSCKSSNGLSLNDNLLTGPNLQNDLFDILIRFRTYNFVLSCDIEKMFLQVVVRESDRDYQRMVWRCSENEDVKTYRLTRLVFGLTNSPYTAMRCIRQLADENSKEFPGASKVLREEIFMDDILCGEDSVEKTVVLHDQLIQILNEGGFKLSKWLSNDPKILPDSSQGNDIKEIHPNKDGTTKVLGTWWNPSDDTLNYRVMPQQCPDKLTKRHVLSSIARLYDPIGLVAPVVVTAKIIMQELWVLNLDWDDEVPHTIKISWEKFLTELSELNYLKITRKLLSTQKGDQIDLIAFSDASLKAYGACIYLRSRNKDGQFIVRLICSKSKISPLKVESLPRLELSAAVLAARLLDKVSKAIQLNINAKYYFTDSTIVLHYISAEPNVWQTYVANRVSQIQQLSNAGDWFHVSGKQNPADLVSRGAWPKQLGDADLYWYGPEFLTEEREGWPVQPSTLDTNLTCLLERKKVCHLNISQPLDIFCKFSSFMKLQRVIAFCLRFLDNCKLKRKTTGFLSTAELRKAHNAIIKAVQTAEFLTEYSCLEKGQLVPKSSKLHALDPYLDDDKLIRVGGRLRNAPLNYDCRHPLILPAKHQITKSIVGEAHIRLLHAGPTQTLAYLRTKYWMLRGRDVVRRIVKSCVNCFRVSPDLIEQKMGDLPIERLESCRPFKRVGLDYFGPFQLKQGRKRQNIFAKAWVALFVCLSSRAVHLEVVGDLTTESFINALKRVISRRGNISCILCDNAGTFVGAKRTLDEIQKFLMNSKFQSDVESYLCQQNIEWKFIPPRAPNFGGLWERLVRSAKQHFKRVTLNNNLTIEEAFTLVTQIEAIINSRPLLPLSNSPSDLEVLTPAHFLIGEPLATLVEHNLTQIQNNRLSRWEHIQKIKQSFWTRWHREVITQLQQRQKWRQPSSNIRPGAVVIVAEDNAPPLAWTFGIIEELFPGRDGMVRVVSVRTNRGIFKRSVRKLALLPEEDDINK